MVVVVVAPVAEDPLYLVQVREPMLREALSLARAVERFDEGVVRRLAGSAEVKLDVIPVGPVVESLAGELGSVVDADLLGGSGDTILGSGGTILNPA
jgi:hypothetical protein